MPVITVVREVHGGHGFCPPYEVDVPNFKITAAELTQILEGWTKGVPEEATQINAKDQRLIYNQKIITALDGGKKKLEDFGMDRDTNMIIVTMMNNQSSEDAGFGAMPQKFANMQHHLLQNPKTMSEMSSSHCMQHMLNTPDFLKSVLNMNVSWRALVDRNPDLNRMFYDEEVRQQAEIAFQNPTMMREIMRTTERAMANIETMPGGFESLRKMNAKIQPKMAERVDEVAKSAKACEELQDWTKQVKPPAWNQGDMFDPNAMASMMQDPNMCQLMSSLAAGSGKKKRGAPSDGPQAANPFAAPAFLQQMFAPSNMEAMSHMQQAMSNMEVSDSGEGFEIPVDESSPAHNFEASFRNFLEAQKENPEIRYRTQLMALRNMGFTNSEDCIAALQRTQDDPGAQGHINKALEVLVKESAM